jgi:hypothetical protein
MISFSEKTNNVEKGEKINNEKKRFFIFKVSRFESLDGVACVVEWWLVGCEKKYKRSKSFA